MSNRIITISREFGSGGRTVGRQAAARLGIPCYDQELIEKLAAESGFAKDFIIEKGEDAPYSGWLANAFTDRGAGGISSQDYLWVIQRKIILGLAAKESCVIVGRCADYILRDTADCLKVFIHADMQKTGRADCNAVWRINAIPAKTFEGQRQTTQRLLSFLYGFDLGKCQKLPYSSGQRCLRD